MSKGVELLFAELVIAQKAHHPHLFLEAALPYANRLNAKDSLFRKCLAGCNGIYIQQQKYSSDCDMNRNRRMVTLSGRVIAVSDGQEKGLFALRYAHAIGREVREIRI